MELPDWIAKSPHRPPNDTEGDTSPLPIYSAVGLLTHTWETIEHTLSTLFVALTEAQSVATLRAFGSVIGSQARCDMIDATVEGFLWRNPRDGDLQREALEVTRTVRRFAALRNIMAHGFIAHDDGASFVVKTVPAETGNFFLTPAAYNTNKTTGLAGPKIWYASRTILAVVHHLQTFRDEIDRLTFERVLLGGKLVLPMTAIIEKTSPASPSSVARGEVR